MVGGFHGSCGDGAGGFHFLGGEIFCGEGDVQPFIFAKKGEQVIHVQVFPVPDGDVLGDITVCGVEFYSINGFSAFSPHVDRPPMVCGSPNPPHKAGAGGIALRISRAAIESSAGTVLAGKFLEIGHEFRDQRDFETLFEVSVLITFAVSRAV